MERFEYKGFGNCNCVCGLDIIGDMVICTQLPDNTGTSITNMAENLAAMVCDKYAIPMENLIWIEHYPAGFYRANDLATYDLVTFELVDDPRSMESKRMFANAQWTRMQPSYRRG